MNFDLHTSCPQLEPETVTPEQFFGVVAGRRVRTGTERLMWAILEDAARVYERARRTGGHRKLLRETDLWVRSNERKWIFSFLRVCETLNLDPTRTREKLRAAGSHRAAPRRVTFVPTVEPQRMAG